MSISEWIVTLFIVGILGSLVIRGCVRTLQANSYCESIGASFYQADDDATPVCMKKDGSLVPIEY